MAKISKNIKKFRKQSQLTQEQLAEQMALTRQAISNWENDKSQPDIDCVARMAEIFHISVEELIYGSLKKVGTEENTENKMNVMKIVLSVFGALFCATGVIIMFAALWEEFSEAVQGVLSFVPILLGGGFARFVYMKQRESAVWREIAGIVWCVGVCSSVAMLHGSLDWFEWGYMIPCCLLCIPIMFLFKPIGIYPIYQILAILSGVITYDEDGKCRLWFLLMLLLYAIGVFYTFRLKKDGKDGFFKFALWINAIAGIVASGYICGYAFYEEEWFFPGLILLFAAYCMLGEKEDSYTLPFRVFGTIGICGISLSCLIWVYDYCGFSNYFDNLAFEVIFDISAVLLPVGIFSGSLVFIGKHLKRQFSHVLLFIASALSVAACFFIIANEEYSKIDIDEEVISVALLLIAALFGISFIVKGVQRLALFELNVGIITMIIAFMILAFEWIDINMFIIGGILIVFGGVLFLTNYLIAKKKKALLNGPPEIAA